jgi:Tol biopolymer transport system component
VLAYAPGPAGNFFRNLFLVNRKGDERKIGVPPQDYVDPAFSPDGKRIAVGIRSATVGQQIVVVDGERGTTINLLSNSYATAPVWSPDGHYLLFDSRQADQQKGIYRIAAEGGSAPQLLKATPLTSHITSVEGDTAAVMVNDPVTNIDLWLLSLREPFEFKPFKVTAAAERQGALSPDGLWIAYASNDSGRSEIFVEPVPGPGGRQQISSDGGEQPRWVRNGKEIVYRNGTKIMSVPVQTQPVFKSGKALELFDRKFDRGGAVPGYDVSTDGQTFVMTRSERDSATQVRVVIGLPFGARPF